MTVFGTSLVDWSQIASNLLTAAALIVGGFWTYFNFFRGRVYGHRLDLTVTGEYGEAGDGRYLTLRLTAKNIGLSRFVLKEGASVLRVSASPAGAYLGDRGTYRAYFVHAASFAVLRDTNWIDAGETVGDQLVLAVPEDNGGLWEVELVVVSTTGIGWKARAVIARTPQPEGSRHARQG